MAVLATFPAAVALSLLSAFAAEFAAATLVMALHAASPFLPQRGIDQSAADAEEDRAAD